MMMKERLKRPLEVVLRPVGDGIYVRAAHYLPLLRGRWHGILHLRNPSSFTEKIIHLKINIERLVPDAHRYADKIRVRDYVAATVGDEHLVPPFGMWEYADDIDWDARPTMVRGSTSSCQTRQSSTWHGLPENLKPGCGAITRAIAVNISTETSQDESSPSSFSESPTGRLSATRSTVSRE